MRKRQSAKAWRKGRKPNRDAITKALKESWDSVAQVFTCHYSGVPLVPEANTPWSLTFDHRTPRDENDLVICAAVINDMKTDLDEQEFRAVVAALAKRFAGDTAPFEKPDLKHFRR